MRTKLFVASASAALLACLALTVPANACEKRAEYQRRAAKLAQLKGTDAEAARAHYLLGVWARDKGLPGHSKKSFEAAMKLDADHAGAREALGYVRSGESWLTQAEAMQARGMVLRDGRWLLTEEAEILDLPAKERAHRKEMHKKVNDLLRKYAGAPPRARQFAAESLGSIEDKYKVEPLAFGLRSGNEGVRVLAAEELGRIGNRRALRPLLHRTVFDPSEEVRHAAIDAAVAIGDANLILPLMQVMEGTNSQARLHAADAMGRTADVRGVTYLVYKYEAHGGGAPRTYFSDITQTTFIQDFDVEVAQTAFIADPIVGVIQDGVVLDVLVIATSEESIFVEREMIHGALKRLTGATNVPNEPGAWAKWYEANKDELVAKSD